MVSTRKRLARMEAKLDGLIASLGPIPGTELEAICQAVGGQHVEEKPCVDCDDEALGLTLAPEDGEVVHTGRQTS